MSAGGRPALFNSVDQIADYINAYFTHIKGEFHTEKSPKTNKDGSVDEIDQKVWDRMPETPTITGLALFMGFESRQSFYDYEKNGEFSYTIKRARLQIESHYEQHLLSTVSTGAIFALKNFGWTDKQELDHTTKGEKMESQPTPIIKVYNTGPSLAGSEDAITE